MMKTAKSPNSQAPKLSHRGLLLGLLALVPTALSPDVLLPMPAIAQISSDGTLSTSVTQNGNNFTINGGDRAGGNLFHSFSEFGVPTGGAAFFNNDLDVENIFSRVTGGNISNIDGLIRANGSANLFLLNPAGIVFGPNARLDIGGSFLGSSASSLMFPGGTEFSATDTQSTPLLTINAPIGLWFRENPGRIVVQGQLQSLVGGLEELLPPQETPSVRPDERLVPTDPEEIANPVIDSIENLANLILNIPDLGLGVKAENTFALVGGEVALEGGQLRAPQGRIELGSVARNNQVSITPTDKGWALGYEGVENFQDVSISGLALVDVSGVGGGEVQVRGADVTITGSSIFAATRGNINGGEIFIGAEQLNIQQNSLVGAIATEGSSRNSGNVTVEINSLNIENSGIFSIGLSEGNAGDITVKAQAGSVELTGTIADGLLPAGLTATTAGIGSGGTLMVETGQLIARDGAGASVTASGVGEAGNVIVTASELIELSGESANGQFVSGLFANSFGTGSAGNLQIETGRLIVTDGATISGTTRRGRGGNVSVTALEFIEVSGTTRDGLFESNLASFAIGIGGEGENVDDNLQGGNLQINTRTLRVSDGGQISASGFGTGQGGTVEVTASESIELSGQSADGRFKSGLFAQASLFPEPFNNIDKQRVAGNLTISTGELSVRDGAEITVSGEGLGAPGDIRVTANSIHLDNQGGVTAENLSRDGGNIELNISDSLNLQNNSRVSTSTSDGVGGTLSIKTPNSVIIDSESRLLSEATGDGTAGSLEISTNQLRVQADSSVAVSSSGAGDAGSLNINAGNVYLDRINISARTFSGGQGNIQLRLDDSIFLNNSTVSASTVEGAGGTVTVNAQNAVNIENGSELSSAATGNNGTAGSLSIGTNQLRVNAGSSVEVSSAGTGSAGNLEVTARNISLDSGTLDARTASGNQGNITLNALEDIQLRNNSAINTNATGTATGGNIFINTDFLIAFPGNSDITANAIEGDGGRIEITGDGILGIEQRGEPTSGNDITVTSTFGSSGEVIFNIPDVGALQGTENLSENAVEAEEAVTQACGTDSEDESSFTVIGRGGVPRGPQDPLVSDTMRVGGDRSSQAAPTKPPIPIVILVEDTEPISIEDIVPARGWIVDEDGIVELTAYPTPHTSDRPFPHPVRCPRKK